MWLVGPAEKFKTSSNLPTRRQVLQAVWFYSKNLHMNIQTCVSTVAIEVEKIWEEVFITKRRDKIIDQIKKLYNDWNNILKSKNKITSGAVEARNRFARNLDSVLDVSCPDRILTSEEKVYDIDSSEDDDE